MALIVRIYVNKELIGCATAVRIEGTADPHSKNKYRLDDGTIITHVYGHGAVALAEKMMRNLKKQEI